MHALIDEARRDIQTVWEFVEANKRLQQAKVLRAFQEGGIGTHCFSDSTGYGYHDPGREALESVYASVFNTEAALVRPQIVSGTQAIAICLGLLRSGEEMVSLSGTPYDTLRQVIGTAGDSQQSMLRRGVRYREVPLTEAGKLDWSALPGSVNVNTRMVLLQRSRGYSWRPSLSVEDIGKVCRIVKSISSDCIVFVDNCYGEFVESCEPTDVGADLMAGSLIKNPGGALAASGGYIVGRRELVEQCAEILTAPGLGAAVGPTFGLARSLLQGFFMAPHVVGEALMGAALAAQVFASLGFPVSPKPCEHRTDIIQAIELGNPDRLRAFCRAIQKASPLDSQFTPIPDAMPGYDVPIIMAGGTFIQGSSIELSADAPMRDPYIVYLQGGVCKEHVELGLDCVLDALEVPQDPM